MIESTTRMPPMVWALLAVTLASCATGDFQRSSFSLIVEGNEASYPAFEAAAKACGYTAYERFPGATVQGTTRVDPHYNLSRVGSRAAICVTRWVDGHPETGLQISGH
jgi:hypothetical protein